MSTPFTRTIQALRADSFRRSVLGLLMVTILLGAWSWWFFRSSLARYEISERARLEVGQSIYLVQAPIAGRIVSSRLVQGQEVTSGEILVEIDSRAEQLQIQEEQTRLRVIDPQVESLEAEITAIERARGQEQQAAGIGLEEAQSRFREAEAVARLADTEAKRLAQLRESGLIAERDFVQAMSQAESRRAAAESLRLVGGRLEDEQRSRQSDREAQLRRLQTEIRRLTGAKTTARATLERLENELERRRVRAPVGGRLGEVAVLRVGGVVDEGDKLGSIVPHGILTIVAEFSPRAALGRIHSGQSARLRLDGFPWTQYGTVPAEVSSVAEEVRDGRVRVDLRVSPNAVSPIPLQHGLPGSVEIEVERLSPATLVLRAAGRLVASPQAQDGRPTQ